MKFFEANIPTLVLRFYMMMAVVIIAGFTGQFWIAIFALPIFLSAMIGIDFTGKKENKKEGKVRQMEQGNNQARKAA